MFIKLRNPHSVALRLLPLACVCACATAPAPLTVERALAEIPRVTIDQPIELDAAIYHALHHDRELAAARARAEAAAANLPAQVLIFGAEGLSSDGGGRAYLSIDPAAWIGVGAQGAANRVAAARGALAWAEVYALERQIEEEIVQAFARADVLSSWHVPEVALDPRPLAAAGLLSAEAAAAVEDANLTRAAESRAIEAGLADLRASVASRLCWIGDDSTDAISLTLGPTLSNDGTEPPITSFVPGEDDSTWLARPDLARALAALVVADAEVRVAAADRYPELRLGPELDLLTGGIGGLITVRLPVFAEGPLRAASALREAARAELERAIMLARVEISRAEYALAKATADEQAAQAHRRSTRQAVDIALVRLSLAPEQLKEAADAAHDALIADRGARNARLARIHAELRLSYAKGGGGAGGGL